MIPRRGFLTAMAAGALAPAAFAHTLYPQWVAYRRKHLLIGCHRKDDRTFELAQELVDGINHALPKAKARPARTPHPERLASLIGTDQLELAVLPRAEAHEMRDGAGRFKPYGRIDLTRIADFGGYVLVADAGFPQRHAWMVSSALAGTELPKDPPAAPSLRLHPGAEARIAGIALEDLPAE